jgi:hypothetical protein
MRARSLTLGLVLPVLAAGRLAGAEEPYAKHLDAKAASVVGVKYVVKVQMGRAGQGQERELNGATAGIVVDACGVVMMPSEPLSLPGRRPANFKAPTPTNLRVVFEGDVKEYEAVLGATDSKLGLSFLRIKDLGDRKLVPVDLSAAVEPKVGDELFGVSRLEQGFDYAPFYGVTRLTGQVTKPRTMWFLSGFARTAHPLFDAQGRPAGIVIRQAGVSDGDETGGGQEQAFLLPAKAVAPTIAQAVKTCADALEKAKTATKEPVEPLEPVGEPAAMGDEPPKPPSDPGMGG